MNAEVEAYGHVLSYKGEDQHSPRLPTSENFDPTVPSRRPPGMYIYILIVYYLVYTIQYYIACIYAVYLLIVYIYCILHSVI